MRCTGGVVQVNYRGGGYGGTTGDGLPVGEHQTSKGARAPYWLFSTIEFLYLLKYLTS